MLSLDSVAQNAAPGTTVAYVPAAAETSTLLLPSKSPLPAIPGYEVLCVLGRGGMGVVYKARQIKANRIVALKMILAGSLADEGELTRFRTEAEAIARLQHPHIVQVFDVGEYEGQPFFSLEFCGGGSLARQLRGLPLPPRDAVGLLVVLADAVHAAHQKGIIHRDLKPANVLLQRDEAATAVTAAMLKITDFGLAKKVDDAGQTASGAIMGTPSYMAPEQARGDSHAIGSATDVYALGAILYELLTGRPPFRAATPVDTVLQVLHDEPVPPRRLQPKTPRDVETICLTCLHKDASRRYASAAELSADLQRFLCGEPIQARAVGWLERAAKWVRRQPAAASLLAVVVAAPLIALLLAGWYLNRQEQFNRQLEEERNSALEQKGIAESNGVEANQQRIEANKQQKRAQEAYRDSQLRLMQMHVATGVRLMKDGDSFAALPWLVTALKEDPRDEATRKIHRYRIGALLRQSPKLTRMFFHPDGVLHVEFSPDGSKFLTTCEDHRVRIWEVATNKEVCPSLRHEGPARITASYSPDGSQVLTVSGDEKIHVWNAASGKTTRTLTFPESVKEACFSLDGQCVLVSAGRSACLWDLRTSEAVSAPLTHQGKGGQHEPILHASFSRDGRWIVATYQDAVARVWDASTIKAVITARPVISSPLKQTQAVNRVAFSPDGEYLVTVSRTSKLRVFRLSPRMVSLAWETGEGVADEACFSPDGSRLVSWGFIRANLWDAKTGARIGADLQHNGQINHVSFSSDGRWVATTSEDLTARVWDVATGLPVAPPLRHTTYVLKAAFSPDGRFLATACADGAARIWDLSAAKPNVSWSSAAKIHALSPDTRYVVALADADRAVSLLDSRTGRCDYTWRPGTTVGYASFSPDSRLVVACADKTAQLWEIASGKERCPAVKHDSDVLIAAVSPDATHMATGCKDGTTHVWDLATRKEIYPPLRHADSLHTIRFSADGHRLITAGNDSKARVWDAATGQPIGPFVPHGILELGIWRLNAGGPAWSRDGNRLATRNGFSARTWDVVTGQVAGPPLNHSGGLSSLIFSPDGSRLLSTSNDCTALQWDVVAGKRLTPAMRHSSFVDFGVYSPDGRRIATTDHTAAWMWDAATGLPLAPPRKVQEGHLLRFSPDGQRLFRYDVGQPGMSIWDVSRDNRPVEDLEKLTNLLTGKQLDGNDDLTPLPSGDLPKLWQKLDNKYPQNFHISPADELAGHRRLAENARTPQLTLFHCDRFLDLDAKDGEIWHRKASAHESLKQWEQAITAYTKALALLPKQKLYWYERGRTLLNVDQYEKAVKDFSQALELGFGGDAWFLRGLAYIQLNRLEEAVADYTQGMKEVPAKEAYGSLYRGHVFVQLRQWDKAAPDFARLVELEPSRIHHWIFHTACQLATNDLAGYRRMCVARVKQFGSTKSLREIGWTGWLCTAAPNALDDFTSLRLQLEQALAENPDCWFRHLPGPLYYRMGKYEQALEQLTEALRSHAKDGGKIEDWLFLAMIHQRLGHSEEAKKWLGKADQRMPNGLPKSGLISTGQVDIGWANTLMLQSLHREATALVNEKKEKEEKEKSVR
jgi:WD40 repeat protein/tetratricopeptide (TPR) repeat protein/tRNA A-37 threonylcarbamoyl transferase component Bud32